MSALYLVTFHAKNASEANGLCWKCRAPLLAPASMRRVFESTDGAVFCCPECLPRDQAANALITVSVGAEARAIAKRMGEGAGKN